MRAIWSGSISFGLVNIPVKLYSAVAEDRINFDMLHKKDLSPIRFARVCKAEDKEIPYEEIVKGYEYQKGSYVVLEDEDFERANIRVVKTITILDFVISTEIDPIYFEKPYYLEPDKGAEKPYVLLLEALKRSGKVGVGKYVLRNREHLVALRSGDNLIILEQMRFHEDVKGKEELILPIVQNIDENEIEMAISLINQLSKPFQPKKYKDTYNQELKKVINEKIEGKIPAIRETAPVPTPVPDLMEMLRRSLAEERGKKEKTKV